MERDEKEFQDVCGLNLTMIKYFFQVQPCLVQVLFDSFDVVSQNRPFLSFATLTILSVHPYFEIIPR